MLTSRAEVGRFFRALRIFITPEETKKPGEYQDIEAYLEEKDRQGLPLGMRAEDNFTC